MVLSPIRGWILDIYPSGPGEMAVWIITENGERVKLLDRFQPKIYMSGPITDLSRLADQLMTHDLVAGWRYVEKYANFMEDSRSTVLELTLTDRGKIPSFIRQLLEIKEYQNLRFHNVDLPDAQAYLYVRDVFPLGLVEVIALAGKLTYRLLDSVESVDYEEPPLRIMSLNVNVATRRPIPKFDDPVGSVALEWDGKREVIAESGECETMLKMVEAIKRIDPDIVLTRGGDSFIFPYLAHRALVNNVLDRLVLGREGIPIRAERRHGKTFFSYGRVYYKAPTHRLYGRVHVDEANTFIYSACGLDGLIEVSRTCRVPLHKAARASIGSTMSSLQLYQATKDGVLIPWKKSEPEAFKLGWELLLADRGGFIFAPRLGIHDGVTEVDFSSMYPTLMATKNISAETALCKCCPDSKLRVPELGYNVCEKREGIVPKTLKMILSKRAAYKRLRNEAKKPKLRRVYDNRQNALKWILVTCFGYLGYRNARFGKVDAHIAICAFAREALLKTSRMAEERGFEVVHGIVDSLWLKKENASSKEYADLCESVYKEIGVSLNVEGRYRWIVFLQSRMHGNVPVLNRYYGVFESGRIKMRGIEAVRKDSPVIVKEAQHDMIKVLAEASNSKEFMDKIPESIECLRSHMEKLLRRDIDIQDLIITKQLSMHPDRYTHDVFQAIAAKQLIKEGMEITGGQAVRYLITSAGSKNPNRRVKAEELIDASTRFDVTEYLNLLILAGANILSPFGYDEQHLRNYLYSNEKQSSLSLPNASRVAV